MKFNMNNNVQVTLTEKGAQAYNDYHNQFKNIYPNWEPKNSKSGDVISEQMWHLFQVFGSHIYLGCVMPFEYCLVDIPFTVEGNSFDEETQIAIVWSIEDVQNQHKQLTDEEARNVLAHVKDKHDCNIGVTWDIINFWIDDLYPDAPDRVDENDQVTDMRTAAVAL